MTTSSHVAVRALRPIAAALLAAGMLIGPPARVAAGGATNHSVSSAGAGGSVGCTNFGDTTGCTQWEHKSPEGVRVFAATDERTKDGDLSKAEVRFTETFAVDGTLTAVSISGRVQTSNHGGGRAIAQAYYDVTLNKPEGDIVVSGNAAATFSGSELIVSDVDFDVEVDCEDDTYELTMESYAGGDGPNSNSKNASFSETVDSSSGYCSISAYAWVDSSTNRPAPGETGQTDMSFQMTISIGAQPTGCDGLSGLVADGGPTDGHDNWLAGVRAQLWRNGSPVGDAVATGDDGSYCIRTFAGVVDPGDYKLRITLLDARHDPPLFETHYQTDPQAVWKEVDVTAADFGPSAGADVNFGKTTDQPWLADVANIHWQTARFVQWVTGTLQISPSVLGRVKVVTFNATQTYSFYDHQTSPPTVSIKQAGTPNSSTFAARNEPGDNGPENAEWHEYAHHVGEVLKIGSIFSAPCAGREPHDGWLNASTCDSLAEGFATFLAAYASLDLDRDRGVGYGDAQYADFANLEDNGFYPWSTEEGAVTEAGIAALQREDFAIAQLLWDLADAGDEALSIGVTIPGPPVETFGLAARDRIEIGVVSLVNLLGDGDPNTITDVFELLTASPLVPAELKTATVEIDDDEVADANAIAEVFLSHGFHPVREAADPRLTFGDVFVRTDHVPQGEIWVERRTVEELAGSGIEFRNSTGQPVEFTVVVDYPTTTSRFPVTVAANDTAVLHLEVPPYWRGILAEGVALPACDAETDYRVTITISAPGETERKLGSCEYLQAVAVATGDAAITFTAGAAGPGPTSAPGIAPAPSPATPLVLIGGAVLLAVVLVVVAVVMRRSRRGTASGG